MPSARILRAKKQNYVHNADKIKTEQKVLQTKGESQLPKKPKTVPTQRPVMNLSQRKRKWPYVHTHRPEKRKRPHMPTQRLYSGQPEKKRVPHVPTQSLL